MQQTISQHEDLHVLIVSILEEMETSLSQMSLPLLAVTPHWEHADVLPAYNAFLEKRPEYPQIKEVVSSIEDTSKRLERIEQVLSQGQVLEDAQRSAADLESLRTDLHRFIEILETLMQTVIRHFALEYWKHETRH